MRWDGDELGSLYAPVETGEHVQAQPRDWWSAQEVEFLREAVSSIDSAQVPIDWHSVSGALAMQGFNRSPEECKTAVSADRNKSNKLQVDLSPGECRSESEELQRNALDVLEMLKQCMLWFAFFCCVNLCWH